MVNTHHCDCNPVFLTTSLPDCEPQKVSFIETTTVDLL